MDSSSWEGEWEREKGVSVDDWLSRKMVDVDGLLGGVHPYSVDDPAAIAHLMAKNPAKPGEDVKAQFMQVARAERCDFFDGKLQVRPHPTRADIWFLRFTNLSEQYPQWTDATTGQTKPAEVFAWLAFNYRGMGKGRGTGPPMPFPQHSPLFGVITPTGIFTPATGMKVVCLPGASEV